VLPKIQACAFSRVCGLAQYILLLSHDAPPLLWKVQRAS